MKNKLTSAFIFLSGLFFLAGTAYAYQLQTVFEKERIIIDKPEEFKIFYGALLGQPAVFEIQSERIFDLGANILIPDISDKQKNISLEVLRDGQNIITLDGEKWEWKNFYDPFAGDNYFKGPEYHAQAPAGRYEIRIFNAGNTGKYALAIGEKKSFSIKNTLGVVTAIPRIKRDFFGESIVAAYCNQVFLLILGIIFSVAGSMGIISWIYRRKKKIN